MGGTHFLICLLLAANVLMRTFTNGWNIAPKIFNVIDLPLMGLICLVSITHARDGFMVPWVGKTLRRTIGFVVVCFLGVLLNLSYFYPMAAASQLVMLVAPLILFLSIERLPLRQDHIDSYSNLLRKLIWIQIVVGVLQIPNRLATKNTEAIHGTFTGNAEHYAAFLVIAICYLAALCVLQPRIRGRYIAVILVVVVINLSLDNKASWVGLAIMSVAVLLQLGFRKGLLKRILVMVPLSALLVSFIMFAVGRTSNTLYKFEKLYEAVSTGEALNLGKVKALVDVSKSYVTYPHMAFVGAGLSNFYSRASRQFYYSATARARMFVDPSALASRPEKQEVRSSDALGNLMSPSAALPFYDQFYGDTSRIYAVGSHQVDSPYSPYAGLLGETGLIGALLYLSVYLIALKRLHGWIPQFLGDARILPLMVSAYGLLIYMLVNSIYGPFLETTRLTSILWTMLALVSVYVRREDEKNSRMTGESALQPDHQLGEIEAVSQRGKW